jgi:hypothetical protein
MPEKLPRTNNGAETSGVLLGFFQLGRLARNEPGTVS